MRKVASSCQQFGPVSTCLCLQYIKFCFQNLRNGREDENGRRYTTFGFDNGKKISKIFCEIWLFSSSKPNVVSLRPFLTSLQFPKF